CRVPTFRDRRSHPADGRLRGFPRDRERAQHRPRSVPGARDIGGRPLARAHPDHPTPRPEGRSSASARGSHPTVGHGTLRLRAMPGGRPMRRGGMEVLMGGKPMRRFRWGKILLVSAAILALLLLPWLLFNPEPLRLDATARTAAPGRFVQLSAGMTHYQLEGPARGRLVVLVHGTTVPSLVWRQ